MTDPARAQEVAGRLGDSGPYQWEAFYTPPQRPWKSWAPWFNRRASEKRASRMFVANFAPFLQETQHDQ